MDMAKNMELLNLLASGLLAGGEFMVWAGLRQPITSLNPVSHIQLRQALILRLRILTPIVFFFAIATGLALIISGTRESPKFCLQLIGEALLVAFICLALFGTVPINKNVLSWNPSNPPAHWLAELKRWETLDSYRCILAMAAFSAFICAAI